MQGNDSMGVQSGDCDQDAWQDLDRGHGARDEEGVVVTKRMKDDTYVVRALPDEQRGREGKRKARRRKSPQKRRGCCMREVLSRNSVSRLNTYRRQPVLASQ